MDIIKDIYYRIKFLLQGNLWAFKYYKKVGITELTFRGVPIILRDDIPENKILIRQKNETWKVLDIKTQKISTLKLAKTKAPTEK